MIRLMKDNIRRIAPADSAGKWLCRGFIACKTGECELPPSPVPIAETADWNTLTVKQIRELLKERGVSFKAKERKVKLIMKLNATQNRGGEQG